MARSVAVHSSREYRADVGRAFAVTLPVDLAAIFKAHGPFPAVDGVRDQDGPWSTAGQPRTGLLGDGSQMHEQLTSVKPGSTFGYELTKITGPLRFLVSRIDGRWDFAPTPSGGSPIAWAGRLHPRSGRTVVPLIAVGALWRGYAGKALDRLAATVDA